MLFSFPKTRLIVWILKINGNNDDDDDDDDDDDNDNNENNDDVNNEPAPIKNEYDKKEELI